MLTPRERRREAILRFQRDFAPFDVGRCLANRTPDDDDRQPAPDGRSSTTTRSSSTRTAAACSPSSGCSSSWSTPSARSASRSRPSTPRGTPASSRSAPSQLLKRFGLARPRSEQDSRIRVMSFSPAVDAPRARAGPGPADGVPHGPRAAALPRRLAALRRRASPGRRSRSCASTRATSSGSTAQGAQCTCGPSTSRPTSTCASTLGVDAIITNRPRCRRAPRLARLETRRSPNGP